MPLKTPHMMNDAQIARAFKALAHPRRAMIFRLLSLRPETGESFGRLQQETGLKDTSLVHHLREMERCGVIARKRHGAFVAHIATAAHLFHAFDAVAAMYRGPDISKAA